MNARSLIFNVIFYVSIVGLMIIGAPMMVGGRIGVFIMARIWASTSIWLLATICKLRVEYRGLHHIPTGGYIIAAKHQSFLETFALLKYTPDFAIIMKKELTYIPIFGIYLIVGNQITINRTRGRSALYQIVRQASEVLRAGRQVYIYPEGTRRPPGAAPEYKSGVALLYKSTRAPCVPVAVNTGLYWSRRGFTRHPGVAIIEYLPALPPGMDNPKFLQTLQTAIETTCARLNEEAIAADPSLAAAMQV